MNPNDAGTNRELINAVMETLRQGECLLEAMDNDAYTRKLAAAFDASIGGHVRHCLDHFHTLLQAVPAGDLNYDYRQRGTAVETDRLAALNVTRDLMDSYAQLDPLCVTRSLMVTCKTSYSANGSQASPSTVGREIMYAVAHAVHHYALIGIMGGIMGLRLPAGFGIAPSTLKHQAEAARIAA